MRAFDRPAYLGLDSDAHWRHLLSEGVERYGTHFAGSRRAPYCPEVYGEAEAVLAAWLGVPAVTLMSSGSLLASTVAGVLLRKGYSMLASPLAHACWREPDVAQPVTEAAWRDLSLRRASSGERVAVVTDRVCPMRCRAADLSWLSELPANAVVVIDDSHAIGVLGQRGCGSVRLQEETAATVLVCASLGKAFSVPGALLASDATWANEVRTGATFGGASPVPPAYAHLLAKGLDYALSRREALEARLVQLEGLSLRHAPGHPAYLLQRTHASRLKQAGIGFATTRYPTAQSDEVLRLVVSAAHTREEVDQVVRLLSEVR